MRLTKEREQTLRKQADEPEYMGHSWLDVDGPTELFEEIDALRAELADRLTESSFLVSNQAALGKEIDNWKWEYENLCKFTTQYEQELTKVKSELALEQARFKKVFSEQMQKVKERDALIERLAVMKIRKAVRKNRELK